MAQASGWSRQWLRGKAGRGGDLVGDPVAARLRRAALHNLLLARAHSDTRVRGQGPIREDPVPDTGHPARRQESGFGAALSFKAQGLQGWGERGLLVVGSVLGTPRRPGQEQEDVLATQTACASKLFMDA